MTPAERVNLLLVQGADEIGTAERVVWELATRLPQTRYAPRVWLSPAAALDELAGPLEERGVAVERIAFARSRWDVRGQAQLWSAMRRARPAIVHLLAEGTHLPLILPAIARRAGSARVVASLQGAADGLPDELAAPLRSVDAVTATFGAAAAALVRDLGLARGSTRVVSNGADPGDEIEELPAARRLRERLEAGPFRPLWVTATRLELEKGHDVLLEALARLRERGLEFVAALAGEGSRRTSLQIRARDLGLVDHVHFLGRVDSLGPLLRAADAFVLPSRSETLPLTLLEAMARARPVVASDIGGVADVVETGIHGHLVPAGDAEALAAALESFHHKPAIAAGMGQRAAERIRSGWTWERVLEAYEAVYDEVLGLAGFVPESAAHERVDHGTR
jgi:glycosyltransferase involved in cell wall biosynthesis